MKKKEEDRKLFDKPTPVALLALCFHGETTCYAVSLLFPWTMTTESLATRIGYVYVGLVVALFEGNQNDYDARLAWQKKEQWMGSSFIRRHTCSSK